MVEVDVQTVQVPSSTDHPAQPLKGDNLSPMQQQQLEQLVWHWSAVFAKDDDDFGHTRAVLHQIPTGTAPKKSAGLVHFCSTQNSAVSFKPCLIQESGSPWAAPMVLEKRKLGPGICVNYRKLNALTHKDASPLLQIVESLNLPPTSQLVFHP